MQDGSMSPVQMFFKNRLVWVMIVVDIVVIVFIIIAFVNKVTKTAVIDFMVAPVDATITINGKDGYKNNGEAYSFTPGTYEVQISHADLDTKTFTLDLEANHNTTLATFLSSDGSFYFYTLRENLDSFNMLAKIASREDNQTIDNDTSAESFIAEFQNDYELYSTALPVTYSEYSDDGKLTKYISIREGYHCTITLCLVTTIYNDEDKPLVTSLLMDAGFNLEDFEIEYKTY